MKVNTVVQTEQGIVKFQGELSKEEAELVVGIGLNYLLEAGAFPDISAELEGDGLGFLVEGPDTDQ